MIVILKENHDKRQLDNLIAWLKSMDINVHISEGIRQTVLGLIAAGRKTFVVADAIGSRQPADKRAALRRMARHGAEIVTGEMVAFEWLGSASHPRFRQALALIK